MRSTTPSVVSKSLSPWRVVSIGDTALLLLAMARGASSGTGVPLGMPQPPRLPFWILVSPLGLKPPLVCIHRQGEYEVRFYVPVLIGRRPEAYRHLRTLPHALRKLLWLVLQHGCGGIPSEARKGDLTNRLPPGSRLHTVWSLKPQNQRGASGSPVFSMTSLPPTSRKMGCGITTGTTSLIFEMETSMKRNPAFPLNPHWRLQHATHSDACMQCKRTLWKCSEAYT